VDIGAGREHLCRDQSVSPGIQMDPKVPSALSRSFRLTLLAFAGVLSMTVSSCVSYRKYIMFDGSETAKVFDHYDLGVWLGHYYSEEDNDSCFLDIWQEYRPQPSDTVRMDSLCRIEISMLCVTMDCKRESYCPLLDFVGVEPTYVWKKGTLTGPFYSFGVVPIPRKCQHVEVSFVATLVENNSGKELERKPMRLTLRRKSG
jgi:hypothetical protein